MELDKKEIEIQKALGTLSIEECLKNEGAKFEKGVWFIPSKRRNIDFERIAEDTVNFLIRTTRGAHPEGISNKEIVKFIFSEARHFNFYLGNN